MNKDAFTLIELMIGVAVLALALGGILISFTANFSLVDSAENLGIAVNHARCVMEEIRDLNVPTFITTDDNGASRNWVAWAQRDFADASGGGGCNTLVNEVISVTYPSGELAVPLEVMVTVGWTEKTRARSVALTTLIVAR